LQENAKPDNLFPLVEEKIPLRLRSDQLMRCDGLETGLLHAADVLTLAFGQSLLRILRLFIGHSG
jgi:hypothetical protein